MAATRENVLAAIAQYVQENNRRAPAKDIALMVGDKLPNVQAIMKVLVADGAISSSRGRNGGALPPNITLNKPVKAAKSADAPSTAETVQSDEDVADQFAALMDQLQNDTEVQLAI